MEDDDKLSAGREGRERKILDFQEAPILNEFHEDSRQYLKRYIA